MCIVLGILFWSLFSISIWWWSGAFQSGKAWLSMLAPQDAFEDRSVWFTFLWQLLCWTQVYGQATFEYRVCWDLPTPVRLNSYSVELGETCDMCVVLGILSWSLFAISIWWWSRRIPIGQSMTFYACTARRVRTTMVARFTFLCHALWARHRYTAQQERNFSTEDGSWQRFFFGHSQHQINLIAIF